MSFPPFLCVPVLLGHVVGNSLSAFLADTYGLDTVIDTKGKNREKVPKGKTDPQIGNNIHGATCRHEALRRLLWGTKEDTERGGRSAPRGMMLELVRVKK